MAQQPVTIPESDYSFGIDARSAETQIQPGFVRDLLNADIVGKRAVKRTGTQGYSGTLPVRATSLEYLSSGQIQLTLDSAVSLSDTTVDLTSVRSSPLVVYGRSNNITSGGPFTDSSDAVKYYPGFSIPTRKTFLSTASAPPYESLNILAGEHGISTTNLFTQVVESTSYSDASYTVALPHTISVNESTYAMTVEYQNGTGTDRDVVVYYKSRAAVAGQTYIAALSHTGSGSETFSISAGTHGLSNYNIIVQVQEDTGSTREKISAGVVISNTGTVSVTIDSISAGTYYAILSATDVSNSAIGNVGAGESGTIQVTGLTSPWIFYGIYQELTPGGNRELVISDSIDYNDATQTATISFTNYSGAGANFYLFYEYGEVRSNVIVLEDDTVSVDATDSRPQITIWGLEHSEIYGSNPVDRSGWVNHIDSYRSTGERRLVAGLGGNLFTSKTYSEAANTYLYPLLYPNLQARTSASLRVGPVFYDTADTPARTRGYITSSTSGTHWANATSIVYDSGSGYTDVTVSLPDMAILDNTGSPTTVGAVISTTAELQDYLTLENMSYSRHNGTHRIMSVTSGTDEIVFRVDLSDNSADYDDTGIGGDAGIFTDQITWLSSAPFIPGDILVNAALGTTYVYTVLSSLGSTTVVSGATEILNLAGGLITAGRRTSSLIPMRESLPTLATSVEDIVRGDMLSYSGIDHLTGESQVERLLRVLSVNPDIDRTIDISVDPDTMLATVELQSGATTYLSQGQKVLLLQADGFSGVQVIADIISPTEFTIALTTGEETAVTGGTLVGGVVEVDEELEWEDAAGDTIYFWAERRWIPVEAPGDAYDLTPSTYVRHLDAASYGNQDFLRSTMVVDNMYLENYSDELHKFDGSNIYRAGLPSWQPGLFLVQDTGASAKIVTDLRSIAYSAKSAALGQVTITLADEQAIPVGTEVRLSGSTRTYYIREYRNDGTDAYLLLDKALDSSVASSGTASEIATFRYYYRLNAIDANDNIVTSAVTGYQDHVVELTADAAVQHKLVGLPAWDNYDYDKLELEIYRTKKGTSAPFYRNTTIQMDFDNTLGYITYTDVFSDSDLLELDPVSTALKGEELGLQWSEPLRAKYITSTGNRLVVGNLKDYPQLDIQIVASGAVGTSTYSGKTWTFRKDNTDTETTTDMINRVSYETIASTTGTASAHAIGTDEFSFTTSIDHSATLVAGDWIYLTYSTVATTGRDLTYSGWWQVSAVSGTTVTVALVGAAAAGSYPNRYVIASDPTNIPVYLGTDGNLGMVNGDSFDLFDLMRRFSMAINASMRMVDISLTGMEGFTPWLMTRGGNDVGKAGRLLVRQPKVLSTTMELVLPSSFSGGGQSFQVFVNDERRSSSANISAVTRIYPSRILASYENYPEIVDNPIAILDTESDSAIDINSADGQEITGIIPFFGEAAFTAAQQAGVLVVFKTNSIYLVDLNQKALGNSAVQRIETEGLGCTAPYSIASTKRGIMFANESGIYCLRRDQSIEYIGKYMERNWTESVNRDMLSIAQGHHYGVGRTYKLSIPIGSNTANSEIYAYNHTGEEDGKLGAWARYDNHPATGWANLDSDAYYSRTDGRVMSLRRTGTVTDYRDDAEPITFRLDTRAVDAGDSGVRKILRGMVIYYRVLQTQEGTAVLYAPDLETEYRTTTQFTISKPGTTTGISDPVTRDVIGIQHNVDRERAVHFSVRIENATIDEKVEIAGIDLRMIGLSGRGITKAEQTR